MISDIHALAHVIVRSANIIAKSISASSQMRMMEDKGKIALAVIALNEQISSDLSEEYVENVFNKVTKSEIT